MGRTLFLFYLLLGNLLIAQNAISPFNGKQVQGDSLENYSFIASGHFHGSGTNRTGYPTNTLLANIGLLNNSGSAFVICLGDLFLDVKNDIPFFEKSFFQKLTIPLFNTVGNHDLSDNIYQEHFGNTNFQLEVNNDLHLFFDTESDNGSLNSQQIDVLKSTIDKSKARQINQVFIYCHRTIWAKHYESLNGLFQDNTQSILGNNFTKEVYPLIQELSKETPVYWFSGSLGDAPASFFYHEDESEQITYIATAIRGLKRDAWLKVNVNGNQLNFETISLTGEQLLPLKSYNVDYWKSKSAKEPFNYRLIPYYLKKNIISRVFWYGVLTTSMLVLIVYLWNRKRNRKKISRQ